MFPLPFTCEHEAYTSSAQDEHGNDIPVWSNPVSVPCFWWAPSSSEPLSAPTGGDRVAADAVLVLDSMQAVDHRDMFTLDGRRFEVIGLPKDYDHGPFGFAPNRRIIELKWVG